MIDFNQGFEGRKKSSTVREQRKELKLSAIQNLESIEHQLLRLSTEKGWALSASNASNKE